MEKLDKGPVDRNFQKYNVTTNGKNLYLQSCQLFKKKCSLILEITQTNLLI